MRECVVFPCKVLHQTQAPVFSLYLVNRDTVRYHVIEQGVLDIAVMERLVGQLAVKPAFQLIFQSKELVLILSQRDFTADMEQARFHLIIDFRKPDDFFP